MHIRLTSRGGPRIRGAATRPIGCRRAAVACCRRSPRARVARLAHPRGGAVPLRRRVFIFAAQRGVLFSVATRGGGRGGGRGRAPTDGGAARRCAAAWRHCICCVDSGGVGERGGCSALARDCRNGYVASQQTSPPDVATPRHLHPMQCHPLCGCGAGARCLDGALAEYIWQFRRRRFRTRRRVRRAPGPRADAGGAGGSAARGRTGRRGARREARGVMRRWRRRTTPQTGGHGGGGGGGR